MMRTAGDPAEMDDFYFALGVASGSIGMPSKRAYLVEAVKVEPMRSYITCLRDELSKVLKESEQ